MDEFATDRIRNAALLAHSGAGKTSLVEALLLATKAINRLGRVEDGNTVSDFDPEEHRRQTSLQLSVAPCVSAGHKLNLVDTPGFADFVGEQVSALRAVDAAILVVSAPSGVEVGTELAWARIRDRGLPTLVFVNKMDRDGADFEAALTQLRRVIGNRCVALNLPVGAAASLSGVADVIGGAGRCGRGRGARRPFRGRRRDGRRAHREVPGRRRTERRRHPHRAARRGQGGPDRAGARGLRDHRHRHRATAPGHRRPAAPPPPRLRALAASQGDAEVSLAADNGGPLAAFVFKTAADPFVGKISYFRLLSGSLRPNQELWDVTRSESERVGQLFVPFGKSQESVPSLSAGDIGAVTKLAHTVTGDTLTTKANAVQAPPIEFSPAVYDVAVHPKSQADLDKMSTALNRLLEEDPSLVMRRNQETSELVVSGMGDTHIDVMAERAKQKFGVELDLRVPDVPYRETISKVTQTEYKHKKQTGGHGQYGHVLIRLEPLERGAGFEFGNEVVGGNVPKEYIPAVEKGVVKAMEGGADGFPIVDLRVVL